MHSTANTYSHASARSLLTPLPTPLRSTLRMPLPKPLCARLRPPLRPCLFSTLRSYPRPLFCASPCPRLSARTPLFPCTPLCPLLVCFLFLLMFLTRPRPSSQHALASPHSPPQASPRAHLSVVCSSGFLSFHACLLSYIFPPSLRPLLAQLSLAPSHSHRPNPMPTPPPRPATERWSRSTTSTGAGSPSSAAPRVASSSTSAPTVFGSERRNLHAYGTRNGRALGGGRRRAALPRHN